MLFRELRLPRTRGIVQKPWPLADVMNKMTRVVEAIARRRGDILVGDGSNAVEVSRTKAGSDGMAKGFIYRLCEEGDET